MEPKSMVAKMLAQVTAQRVFVRKRAISGLWERNKLTPNEAGYKIAETPTVHADGREVVEYRLYKLVDASVTTLKADIQHTVETGKDKAVEMKSHGR